jgi:hypothetical protein
MLRALKKADVSCKQRMLQHLGRVKGFKNIARKPICFVVAHAYREDKWMQAATTIFKYNHTFKSNQLRQPK